MRRGRPRHLIGADDVDCEDALELGGVEQVHAPVRNGFRGRRVVDQHVEPAKLVDAGLHQSLAVLVLGNVALHRDRVRAHRPAGRRDRLAAGLVGGVVHDHVAAAMGKNLRAFRADAIIRACPRDDGGLSLQFQHTSPVSFSTSVFHFRTICAALASTSGGKAAIARITPSTCSPVRGSTSSLRCLASSRKPGSFMVASKARRKACTRSDGTLGGVSQGRPVSRLEAWKARMLRCSSVLAYSKMVGTLLSYFATRSFSVVNSILTVPSLSMCCPACANAITVWQRPCTSLRCMAITMSVEPL